MPWRSPPHVVFDTAKGPGAASGTLLRRREGMRGVVLAQHLDEGAQRGGDVAVAGVVEA